MDLSPSGNKQRNKQNKANEQNKTKQNKTKDNKTIKQNKINKTHPKIVPWMSLWRKVLFFGPQAAATPPFPSKPRNGDAGHPATGF